MNKNFLVPFLLLLFSSSCFSFEGVSVQYKAMEMVPSSGFEITPSVSKEILKYQDGRLLIIPKSAENEEVKEKFNILMKSCNDCQDVPVVVPTIGGKQGGGRTLLPITSPSDYCKKYPGLFGCPKKEN